MLPIFVSILLLPGGLVAGQKPPRQQAGKYEVTLRLPADGLYAQEEMQIEFRVVDTSQDDPLIGFAPVIRAGIRAVIDMPAMPSMPRYEELAHSESIPGEYGVHPTFAHGGEFRMRLSITPPADQPFEVMFPLPVLDASEAKNRKPGPQPFQLELRSNPKNPKAGQPADLQFIVHARERPKEVLSSFEVMHEKLLHLLVLRSDLTQFAHEHPEKASDGTFHLRFTFPAGGEYRVFADLAPGGAGEQVLMARIKVSGDASRRFDVNTATAEARSPVKNVEGVTVSLQAQQPYFPAKKTGTVTFSITDAATGKAVTDLEPYLGAMGHLMIVHQDGVTFVHAHPDERVPEVGRNGTVPFLVRFPKTGLYRGWPQFQRNGQVLTSDFIFEVKDSVEAEAAQ